MMLLTGQMTEEICTATNQFLFLRPREKLLSICGIDIYVYTQGHQGMFLSVTFNAAI